MIHLLGTKDLDKQTVIRILDTAEEMSQVASRSVPRLPALRGKTIVNLFYEDSTRTRTSFEIAAKMLSADVVNFSAKGSSVSKGESLKDTAQTLAAMGADAIVMRHSASGAAQTLAESGWVDAQVVNAGDGTHEHPTQALLDAFTIRRRVFGPNSTGKALDGLRVAIVGDVLHSRVARSNIWLLTALGVRVTLVGPATFIPNGIAGFPVDCSFNFDEMIDSEPDAVMMLRVQSERIESSFFPNSREYARHWGLSDDRAARLPKSCLIMHPGPMNRGLEISSSAADSVTSTIREQVANGISVRMAVLFLLLSGAQRIRQ